MPHVTQNHLPTFAFRGWIIAVFAFGVFAGGAPAQPIPTAKPNSIDGVYYGSCPGEKGPIKFKLSLTQQGKDVVGLFTWYLPEGSGTHAYTCEVSGAFTPGNPMVRVFSGKWETPLPGGFNLRGLDGVFDPDGGNGAGQISGDMLVPSRGPKFQALRDAAESAKMAGAIAGKKEAGPPTVDVAQQATRQRAGLPAAAPSSPPPGSGTASSSTVIDGVYNGSWTPEQGPPTKFKLTITQPDGRLTGVFTVYPPQGAATKSFTCDLVGRLGGNNRAFELVPDRGGTPPPAGVDVPGLSGVFDPAGGNGAGQISGKLRGWPAPTFQATRDAAESARLAAEIAAKAPPAGPTGINGVYTGTYNRGSGFPPTDVKFSVKAADDGSLAALFTFDLPKHPGSSVTYKLTGRYDAAARNPWGTLAPFQFTTVEPMGSLVLDKHPFTHTVFDASKVNHVQVEILSPSRIGGEVMGRDAKGAPFKVGDFGGTRDKTELADLDKVMAAQLHAAANPAPPIATAKPGIEGVFNGTYTKEKGPPTKFKLTIMRNQQGVTFHGVIVQLTGVATIYLPTDSGTKAYTYSLKGSESPDGHGHFSLSPYDWETTPPKDFEDRNLKSMGFNGTIVLDSAKNAARIVNINIPKNDRDDIPTFEAAWDAMESSDTDSTIADQKTVDAVELAVALKERDEAMRNAPPKQLAAKGLVRKSQAHWNGYRGDSVRQIFDGGFADDAGDDPSFQVNFMAYVDLFSKNCSANLPANHHPITILTTTYRDGQVAKTESKTVDIDPRFIKKYCEFSGVEPDPGSAEAADLAAKNAHIFRRVMQAGSPAGRESNGDAIIRLRVGLAHAADDSRDLSKFFATETGSSAAMRQLTENFLRAATGEPSLQEAGEKIDGAEAETDKDAPPGRFTHLIDAANAYCRDPANAKYRSKYDSTLYMLLAEKYRGVMTPDEEYYYANDFAGRFRDQIMGARANSTDPAWPRLHPAFEESMQELGR